MMWRPMIAQKLSLVCYKSGSDEIVGASMLFALTKDDDFLDQIKKRVISSVSVQTNDDEVKIVYNFSTRVKSQRIFLI